MPAYATFIKTHLLSDFVTEQIRMSYELKIPVLQYFAHLSKEEFHSFSMNTTHEFLSYLENNLATEQISTSLSRWVNNQYPQLSKGKIVSEDITLVTYVRKQAFLFLIKKYTTDLDTILNLVQEIDQYSLASETASFKTYSSIVSEKISEQVNLIEHINNTSPGMIYVLDLTNNKLTYANKKIKDFTGYTFEELEGLDIAFVSELEHPDDLLDIKQHYAVYHTSVHDEIRVLRHRVKQKDGNYRWVSNYENIFKRDENGIPQQIIGISLDIDNLVRTTEKLSLSEEQLLQAQSLAEIGSFEWNLETGEGSVTPQLLKILELQEAKELLNFAQHIHPNDKQRVQEITTAATIGLTLYDYECRYLAPSKEKLIWSRGYVSKFNGSTSVRGTIMDVTERNQIFQKLQRSDELFRQAQALTHIGNWTWDIKPDTFSWSDELYRIYGLEPLSIPIDFQTFISFIHPGDRENTVDLLNKSVDSKAKSEYLFRIIATDKQIKILQGKSEVITDENGKVVGMVGTCQDVTEKQLLIEKLQQSELLFKQAQSLSKIGNWSYTKSSGQITWSDELYNIYELDPLTYQLSFEALLKYDHPEDVEMVQKEMEKGFETGKNDFFYRIILENGITKTLHAIGETIKDPLGEVVSMAGTVQDVTRQTLIERELLENQTFVQKIADSAPSIISSYHLSSGKYSFVNYGFKKLLGYEASQLLNGGQGFFRSLIHSDDLPMLLKEQQTLLESTELSKQKHSEVITEVQYRVMHNDGAYRWLRTFATVFDRNSNGKAENILEIAVDITEYMEAERKLMEQEHFIQNIAEASPTILYLYDLVDKKFVYINKEVRQVLGYEPEDLIEQGNKVASLYLHPEDTINSKDNYVRYHNTTGGVTMHQFEGRVRHKNKKWVWLLAREIVFKCNAEGKPLQVLGSALDITLRKEMEQSLVYKTLQLQQSNASLEEFAHVSSHDLQEPLRKISTFADRLLISHRDALSIEGQTYLSKIVLSAKRMQQLINDILSISVISGDKAFEWSNLNVLVEDVLQTLDFKIESLKADIKVDTLPEAYVNKSQIRQLFQNLVSNSLKFSRADVDPKIRISYEFITDLRVTNSQLRKAQGYHKITLKDNGIGFDNIFADKIFNIFQRLNGRSEFEGTGIGLSICKKILENHGGIISAIGELNNGAVFTIVLPDVS